MQIIKVLKKEGEEIRLFFGAEAKWLGGIGNSLLGWLTAIKTALTKMMYWQRGRFSQSFVSLSMAGLAFFAILASGKLEDLMLNKQDSGTGGSGYLLMASEGGVNTLISNLPKGDVTEYRVQEGDTVSSIAQKFGVTIDTIVWENNLKSADDIKPQQILRILPTTGISHEVKRGETVYSIAKKYQVDAQNLVDYPFNTFANDETFALTAGQNLMIPGGIKPKVVVIDTSSYSVKTVAPIPGVVGEGSFMWPTSGRISQGYYWYHKAVDIANNVGPDILASQTGTVTRQGWGGGYGNMVVIDHGNGYQTLYAHMVTGSVIVQVGQKVNQGQKIGRMGSTGRSTGTHLHFEVIYNGGKLNPLTVLK